MRCADDASICWSALFVRNMDDPNFSVSLVNATNENEHKGSEMDGANVSSNWIGTTKDCHALWDTLQAQGQLFKILDTLTAKTSTLIGRLQNRTATEEDSVTALGLLSQLGIMFIDVETKEDGSKERRFSFLTDVDPTLPKQPQLSVSPNHPLVETVPLESVAPQSFTAVEETGDENKNQEDALEPVYDGHDFTEAPGATEVEPPPLLSYVCEWCGVDQGTAVMLDLHHLQYCQTLMKPYKKAMHCPSCDSRFRKLARFQTHLLNDHSWKREDAVELLRKFRDELGMKPSHEKENLSEKENGSESEAMATLTKVMMDCEVCQKKFGTRMKLRSHLMDAHCFSRDKAAGSVHKSVRSAHTIGENTIQSDGLQKKYQSVCYVYRCSDCNTSHIDRFTFVNHMTSEHGLLLSKAQKQANKQYRLMNAKFACDLCPCKYSDRYVLFKHFVGVHKFSKSKAHTKVFGMYPSKKGQTLKEVPSSESKEPSKEVKDSESYDTDMDVEEIPTTGNNQRILRSASKRKGVTRRHIKRRRALVVKKEKKNPKTSKAQEVKEGSHNKNEEESRDESETEEQSTDLQDEDYDPAKSEELNNSRSKQLKTSPKKKVPQSLSPKPAGHSLEIDVPVESDISVTSHEKLPEDSQNVDGESVEEGQEDSADAVPSGSEGEVEKSSSTEKPPAKRKGRRPVPGSTAGRPVKHKCPHCEKTFQFASYAKIHIAGVHKETPDFQCSTCQKTFNFRSTFLRHLTCHKNEELGICFFCDACGKGFYDKYTLDQHRKTHITDKPYKCDYCNKGFDHKSVLLRHRNTHTKEIEYKCSHCSRVFYRKGGLKYHLKAFHENTRDFVCTLCSNAFPCKSTLVAHGLTHSEHRAFQCDTCGIRVKTKGNLKEHIRCVHTDNRAFECDICNKTFNRSHRLTLHMMMHRDERPHKCNLCDKAFRTRTNLRVHIKWHRDQRDFQCEQCGKTFLIPGNLDRHMQTHKNGKVSKRRNNRKLPPHPESKTVIVNPNQAQIAVQVQSNIGPTVESHFQTVQNLVASGGFESDLPTLASIAQHLSTMNIPVFQVPSTSSQVTIPVTIPADATCTPLPGSVISTEASQALAVFSHAHQQQIQEQNPPVSQAVQEYEQVQLTIQ